MDNRIKFQNLIQNELKQTQRELSVLYEVSNAMRTTLEFKQILHVILTGVTSHSGLGYNRAVIFLPTPDNTLEPKMAVGPKSGKHAQEIWSYITNFKQELNDLIKEEKYTVSEEQSSFFDIVKDLKISLNEYPPTLLTEVFQQGLPRHLTAENMREYANDPLIKILQSPELILMPIRIKEKVVGIIVADNVYTHKPITQNDLKIFTMLANQAGLAIDNAQLYEQVRYKSDTDSITGLYNHGFFQRQLSKEVQKSQELEHPICLIILDIDNFKQLNDTYGHQIGDQVLKEIAKLLLDSSRDTDFVCRYGGEEFSIILTRTDKSQGIIIAERIRKCIESHDFANISAKQKFAITVSIGISCFPDDVRTKEDLIAHADKAMYTAKFSGKNQICTF